MISLWFPVTCNTIGSTEPCTRLLEFESQLCGLLAMWPWASYLALLCLSSSILKWGIGCNTISLIEWLWRINYTNRLLWWLSGKESTCQCRIRGIDPWIRKVPGEGNGSPLLCSCLENPTDRGAWGGVATVHGVVRIRYDWVTKPPPPISSLTVYSVFLKLTFQASKQETQPETSYSVKREKGKSIPNCSP